MRILVEKANVAQENGTERCTSLFFPPCTCRLCVYVCPNVVDDWCAHVCVCVCVRVMYELLRMIEMKKKRVQRNVYGKKSLRKMYLTEV